MARQPSNNELQKNYEVTIQAPLDSRLSVLNLTDLLDKNSWFKLVEDDFGEEEVAFMAYKGMPVSNTAEGDLYILKDYKEGPSVSDSQISFQKVATEEWVQTYADNNDTDTKYGIEYDADNKKIKLVEGGLTTEIDVSNFIKEGMLSSVVADEANNKLTFYWNTAAGIETTEIALSSIADIYTGVEGDDITVSVSNENKISATLAEAIKTAIGNGVTAHGWGDHAQAGYAKTADLGELASKDNLSAADVGAYTKEEVDDLITNEFQEVKIINPNGEVKGTITFDGTEGSHLQASTGLIANAFGANKSLNEISLYENTCYAKDGIKFWLPESSDYYSLKYPSSFESNEEIIATQEWVKAQGYGTGSGSIDTGDSSLGCSLHRWLTISSSGGLSTTEYTLTGINIKPYGANASFSVLLPTEAGTLATQQWVEAQEYGQGSGSIDTTKFVTLDEEQTIIGNKTFTGDVDFSNATVKGLAIDPADVDLAGYATEDWVKSQGYVTASYLDNILTFSTSGSEASAVNYSNDEVLFTEDLYVTNPMGDFVSGDNVKGLSLQEIITRLLKLETNI